MKMGTWIKINLLLILLVVFAGGGTLGQGARFSLQMGAAVPVGKFNLNEATPDSGGFAQTGFNIHVVLERFNEKGLVVGASLGYSVFGMDKEAIREYLNPQNPNDINVETQSFQNFTLLGRIGYQILLFKGKLNVVPGLEAGLGVFNSAYYLIDDGAGNEYLRSGNTDINFLWAPGLEFWIPLNSFTNIKLYSLYQFATYTVEESFSVNGVSSLKNTPVEYDYSSVMIGLGITATF
jgi:hypothetical protein